MTDVVLSVSGIALRLTEERWRHIAEEHQELAALKSEVIATVATPERILAG